MSRTATIYALIDVANDGRVRYVGRTVCSLATRLLNHHYNNMAVSDWVRANSDRVQIVPLETVPFTPWAAGKAERKWIEHYRSIGHDLFNVWPRMERGFRSFGKGEDGMTHTPGPWFAEDFGCDNGADKTVIASHVKEVLREGQSSIWPDGIVSMQIADCRESSFDHETAIANAHLIAAAPDLLAALEEVLKYEGELDSQGFEDMDAPYYKARAVIAKARNTPARHGEQA